MFFEKITNRYTPPVNPVEYFAENLITPPARNKRKNPSETQSNPFLNWKRRWVLSPTKIRFYNNEEEIAADSSNNIEEEEEEEIAELNTMFLQPPSLPTLYTLPTGSSINEEDREIAELNTMFLQPPSLPPLHTLPTGFFINEEKEEIVELNTVFLQPPSLTNSLYFAYGFLNQRRG